MADRVEEIFGTLDDVDVPEAEVETPDDRPAIAGKSAKETRADDEDEEGEVDAHANADDSVATDGAGTNGEAHEAPVETEDDLVRSILDEYATPDPVRRGRGHIEKLAKGTDAEKKASREYIERALTAYEESFEEGPNGPSLRPEVASRAVAMRGQRGAQVPDEAKVRAEVSGQYEAWLRKSFAQTMDEEHIPTMIASTMKQDETKERINAEVAVRMKSAEADYRAERAETSHEIGGIVQKHLQKHPDDAKLMPEIGKFLNRFPPDLLVAMITEGWFPFDEVAAVVRTGSKLESAVKAAFKKGMEFSKGVKPSDSGAPSGRGPAPRNASSGEVARFKQGIRAGSGLPGIDSLAPRK